MPIAPGTRLGPYVVNSLIGPIPVDARSVEVTTTRVPANVLLNWTPPVH